jgi:hypothetical protein
LGEVVMKVRECLDRLGFSPTDGPELPERIEELENLIGVRLPADYRDFLREVGGGYLADVLVPCTVPAPFGEHLIASLHTVGEVIELLDSDKAPRNMVCIGYGHFGMTTCLSVAGLDHGQVFSLDTEMRFFWDKKTLRRMPHLDPAVREFFRLRDADQLPRRPWGYENCYHVAKSFTEFLGKMHSRG